MRILLIEDDPMIGAQVRAGLRDTGIAVDWVKDGMLGLHALRTEHFDLALLDLGLPKLEGLQVLKQARMHGCKTPVLILTARDALGDRIGGLDEGADDYIVKPFELAELQARMRAVLRRHHGNSSAKLSNGVVTLDLSTREAHAIDQAAVTLSQREFALLQALLMRPGAILSRSDLEDRIYGWGEEVESNAVEYLIHMLRKKLGNSTIKNVRGLGWMVDKSA